MAKLVLKKALFNKNEVLKRGEDTQQLEKFRKLILDHLSTLDDDEPEEGATVKKAFSKIILMLKGGLPVGTIHTYRNGKKYIKSPSGKWIPKYDSHTRGAKMAVAAIRRKIAAAPDAQTMMQIILENRDRFSDKNGQPLPFVQELSKYVAGEQDRREQEVKRQRKEKQDSRKKADQQAKNTPQESKAVQPKDEKGEGQEKTPEAEKKQAAEQAGGKQGDGTVEPDKGKKRAKVTDKKGRLKPGTRMTGAEWKENGYKTYDKNGLSREMRDDRFYTADTHNGLYEDFKDFKARDKRTEGTISGSEEVTAETGKLYQEVLKIAYDGRIPTLGEIELTRKIYENHDIGEITGLLARGKFVALRPSLNDNVLYVDENGDEATTNYNLLDDESQKKLQAALRQYIKTKQSIQKSISNVIDFFRNLQVGKGPRFVKKSVPVRGADGEAELSERWMRDSIEGIAPYVEEAGISETGKKVVAVDFDGVINSYLSGWKGPTETDEPVLSAAESLKTLFNHGYKVIIFSTRANSQEGIDTIREYLRKHTENNELADTIEITDQKPIADVYIDDRAIPFNGDWKETLKKIEEFRPWTEKSLTWSGYPLQGRTKIHGMDISIENKKGSVRSGTDKDGHDWSIKMNYDYGYIRGTVGKDKDHVDCYLGPNPEAETVFIVHQNDPATGEYDEDKVMLGFNTEEEARKAYLSQYDRPGFLGDIDAMDIETFKEKAFDPANKGKRLA